MSRLLTVHAFAKINLTLDVGPRRADGFHELRTLLQSIALRDRLTMTPRQGPFVIVSRAHGLPADRSNLVYRAAERLWRALGREGDPRDAHVKLEKAIPVAAGLGGGSADAAAALWGLNALWRGGLDSPRLSELAAELGSDVPFFLLGGTALGTSRGDELYPTEEIRPHGIVLIKPSFGVATADAYRWLDEDRAEGVSGPASGDHLDVGWPTGPIRLRNDLQAPVARRHPLIAEMLGAIRHAGARAASMTGSGSTIFGVFSGSVPRAALRRLQRPDWLVLVTRTISRREAVRRSRVINF
jgi:4-diphosphocytidyl-2-C-methyl-D-erythritol kinase